jgi:hypothetical protein
MAVSAFCDVTSEFNYKFLLQNVRCHTTGDVLLQDTKCRVAEPRIMWLQFLKYHKINIWKERKTNNYSSTFIVQSVCLSV